MIYTKYYLRTITCVLLILVSITACKKKKAFKEENAQTSVDVRMFHGQNDEALADINLAIMGQSLLRGRGEETSLESICGLDLDTALVYKGILHLVYNGNSCRGVSRSGEILVTIMDYPLKKWKNAGTTLKIDFVKYKATWLSDGKSVQIDGTEYLLNESGKTWYDLQFLNVPSCVQILSGENLKVSYGGTNDAKYHVNRRMEYSYSKTSKTTSCLVNGLETAEGESEVESWGLNRDGESFATKVVSGMIWKTGCGAMAPVDGELKIKMGNKAHTLNCFFAVDKEGNETNADSPCPYGWQVKWSYKNKTSSRIFNYY